MRKTKSISGIKSRESGRSIYFKCLIGYFSSLALSVVILSILTLIITKVDMEHSVFQLLATSAVSFSVMISSFFVCKKFKKDGLITGLINGFFVVLTLVIISLIVNDPPITLHTVSKLIAFISSGAIGGTIGVNMGTKRRLN